MSTNIVEILQYMFESWSGYLCLGRIKRPGKKWEQEFFHYPEILRDINDWVKEYKDYDLYSCPHLLKNPNRKKEEACASRIIWADLDDCSPDKLGKYGEPLPNIIIQTSQTHYQAYWKLNTVYSPDVIENLNHRIYEAYESEGCDACWALTHPMRLPYTTNHKREKPFKMKTAIDWGYYRLKSLDTKLPLLGQSKPRVSVINTNEGALCKFAPDQLGIHDRQIWFEHVSKGERSERVFELVRLAINQLKCNDSGAIALLMGHPTLKDKFPNEELRMRDIIRCLTKREEVCEDLRNLAP